MLGIEDFLSAKLRYEVWIGISSVLCPAVFLVPFHMYTFGWYVPNKYLLLTVSLGIRPG